MVRQSKTGSGCCTPVAGSDKARAAAAAARRRVAHSRSKGMITVPGVPARFGYQGHQGFKVTRHQYAKALVKGRQLFRAENPGKVNMTKVGAGANAYILLSQRKGRWPTPGAGRNTTRVTHLRSK